jgi:hypothetical protein
MVELTKEQDLETLRQIGLLLDRENQRLITKTLDLTTAPMLTVPPQHLNFEIDATTRNGVIGMTRPLGRGKTFAFVSIA